MNAWSIAFAPLLPVPVLEGLAGLALALIALTLWRRPRGAAPRALAFALLGLGLLDPSLVREDRRPLKDVVAVVIDQSAANQIGERPRQTAEARAELEKRLAALDNVEARFVETAKSDPDNRGTQLFAALRSALSDTPPERVGAAILVTDGVAHDIPSSLDALGFDAPLHVLVTGHEGERNRRIELVEAPRFGIVGKDQVILARVLDTSQANEPATLTVRRDGERIATLSAEVGQTVSIKVPVEHAGPNVIELEVAPIKDELTTRNGKAVVTIEGVRDKLRVLLVSGEPHQGERMWRNLLKSDANVDLVHFTILRPPDKATDGTPINELSLIAFPVADLFGRKIKDFDLIIFDRYSSQAILPRFYLDNIVKYVREGGALLMAEGPAFGTPEGLYDTPLGEISPARPTGEEFDEAFRAEISPDGVKHPVTRGLRGGEASPPSWGRWFRQIGGEVTSGSAVLQGAGKAPLLVLSRVDKGRVALLLSDQMWLWARGYDGGGPHLDLLRRLAHWLMKEPELEEEALRAARQGTRPDDRAPERQGRDPASERDRAGRQDDERPTRERRPRAFPRDAERRSGRALSRERRRADRARGRRPGKSARIPGSRLDDREAAPARRGERGKRAPARAGGERSDRRAQARRHAPIACLRRRRLHRGQAGRGERARRRRPDAARRRLSRPRRAARRADLGLVPRGRRGRRVNPLLARLAAVARGE